MSQWQLLGIHNRPSPLRTQSPRPHAPILVAANMKVRVRGRRKGLLELLVLLRRHSTTINMHSRDLSTKCHESAKINRHGKHALPSSNAEDCRAHVAPSFERRALHLLARSRAPKDAKLRSLAQALAALAPWPNEPIWQAHTHS